MTIQSQVSLPPSFWTRTTLTKTSHVLMTECCNITFHLSNNRPTKFYILSCISLQILGNNQLFISCLYMFRASQRSSSGDRIILIHHLVWLFSLSDCWVCRSEGNCWTDIPSIHLNRIIIPDDVLIQFDLLMMSAVMLEICSDVK